jgi:hypothetical protein
VIPTGNSVTTGATRCPEPREYFGIVLTSDIEVGKQAHDEGRIHGRHNVRHAIDNDATTHMPPRLHRSPTTALARIPEQELRPNLAMSARFTSGASPNPYFSPAHPSLFNLVRSRIVDS